MASNPVGQKQHRQERTAGIIQSVVGGARWTTRGTNVGWRTCTKIVVMDANLLIILTENLKLKNTSV